MDEVQDRRRLASCTSCGNGGAEFVLFRLFGVRRSRASLYGSVRTLFSKIFHEAIYTQPETPLRRGC